MNKKSAVLLLTLAIAGALAACAGNPGESTSQEPQQTAAQGQEAQIQESGIQEAPAQTDAGAGSSASQDSPSGQEDGVLTGKLEENKGFMFLITSDEDKETYVFPLTEDQEGLLDDFAEGDTLKVSYTNGLPSPDNLESVVVSVEKVE